MKPVVYIDMLFLVNFLMDSVVLFATSLFLRTSLHLPRMLLTAVLCALYSSVMFFPQISFLYSVFFKIVFLIFAAWIAFPTKTPFELFKNSLMLFFTNLIFGGVMFALIFVTDFGTAVGTVVSNGEIYLDINPSTLISSTVLAYLVSYVASYVRAQAKKNAQITTALSIHMKSGQIELTALCDTGCSLADPVSGRYAAIISPKDAKKLLPCDFFEKIENSTNPEGFETIYRALPFCTVENKNGILHGFIPDKLFLDGKEVQNSVVAISKSDFISSSEFSAIFNPKLLENENFIERKAVKKHDRSETLV